MGTKCTIFINDLPRMLPTKFWFIWLSGFREEDFLVKAEWKVSDTGLAHWASSWLTKHFEINGQISCFRVLFGCISTFEHPAYLNSGKKWCGRYASVVYLIAKYYEMFAFSPPFFRPMKWAHIILNFVDSCFYPINYVV
jgi:hypothetical protein